MRRGDLGGCGMWYVPRGGHAYPVRTVRGGLGHAALRSLLLCMIELLFPPHLKTHRTHEHACNVFATVLTLSGVMYVARQPTFKRNRIVWEGFPPKRLLTGCVEEKEQGLGDKRCTHSLRHSWSRSAYLALTRLLLKA